MDALRKASDLVGGFRALSEQLGVSYPAVWAWHNKTRALPAEHCPTIERITKGKVTCEQLRPDVDWAVLRKRNAPRY